MHGRGWILPFGVTPQLFLPDCCSSPGLKSTELQDQSWDKDCASGWSSSLKTKLRGTPCSVFEFLCGEELCTFAGSSVRHAAGKSLKL